MQEFIHPVPKHTLQAQRSIVTVVHTIADSPPAILLTFLYFTSYKMRRYLFAIADIGW